MTEQVKQHTLKVLEFLKNHQDIDSLTLKEIQERIIEYEGLLIEFVEKVLEDEEDINGTMTTWWLFENVDKVIWEGNPPVNVHKVEKAEHFVNYILNEKGDKRNT